MRHNFSLALLRTLYRRLQIPTENIQFSPVQDVWTTEMKRLLQTQGYQTHVWNTSLEQIAPQIGEGLPALGISPRGEWILLEHTSWNWIRYYNLSRNRGGWSSIRSLNRQFDSSPVTWLLIEPIQAKSCLSSTEKRFSPLKRLFRLVRIERFDLLLITLLGALIGLFSLTIPLTIQTLINWVSFGRLTQPILYLSIAVFMILLLSAGLSIFQRLVVERLERRLFLRTVEDLSRRFYQVKVPKLDKAYVPDLANRFFDILTIQKATGGLLLEGLSAMLQILVATTVLALYHPWFIILDVMLITGMMGLFWVRFKKGTETAIIESKTKYKVASWIETIGSQTTGFRVGDTPIASLESERRASTWLEHREEHFYVFLQQYGAAQIFQVLMSVFVLFLGVQLVLNGELTIGQFVAAEFVVTTALLGFTKFMDKIDTIYDLLASIDKIGNVLDLEVEEDAGLSREDKMISVTLDSVQIRPNTPVLNATMPAGGLTYFQCPITSSPQWIAESIIGLRPVHMGDVKHNDIPISLFGIADRYRSLQLLSGTFHFQGTIRENITMGRPTLRDLEIWRILKKVGIDSLVLELGGLDAKMNTHIPVLHKGLLLTRALLNPSRLMVVYSFFEGLPPAWIEQWLHLLLEVDSTVIILETHIPFDLDTLNSDLAISYVGDFYAYCA